jgi:putative methyltransferase (TIGR04325 family)
MQLRDFLPPIVVKMAKRSKQRRTLYNSYEDALAACRGGYEENDFVNVVYEKTRRYRDSLLTKQPFVSEITSLRTLIGLALSSRPSELNVIDFGGACGAHYFLTKAVFGKRVRLRWHVVETSAMVSKAIGLEDGRLKFFDDLQKATSGLEHVDLVYSDSVLPYVPRPYAGLKQLTECGATNIFITRVGLSTEAKELVVIQESSLSANGPGPMPQDMRDGIVQYPVTFARKDRFEEILGQNYSINIIFEENRGAYQAANHSIDMYGYFCVLK